MILSPDFIHTGGLRAKPTPWGVPVRITRMVNQPINILMKLPTTSAIPSHSIPATAPAVRSREDGQWLLGLILSFFWLCALNVPLAITLGESRWPHIFGAMELVLSIALLVMVARVYRRQYGSWAWGRGALIGGVFPA